MATSLRNTVSSEIGTFLLNNGFSLRNPDKNPILVDELVSIVNSLSDYYEEGEHLYPEVLLTNNISDIPFFIKYDFHVGELLPRSLSKAIKMCAPLCNEGWCIFLEVNDNDMRWGVVNGEQKITSLSLLEQLRLYADDDHRFILLHNIGAKTVEFLPASDKQPYAVSLSLNGVEDVQGRYIHDLCETISEKCEDSHFCGFLEKVISYALQIGHGNLVAVLKKIDREVVVPEIFSDGVLLSKTPIDLYEYYIHFKNSDNDIVAHELLKKVSNLVEAMLNHDGICLFTNDGNLVGYHLIVDNKTMTENQIVGGARTKAFKKLVSEDAIFAVLMKTQEGLIQFNKQGNEAR